MDTAWLYSWWMQAILTFVGVGIGALLGLIISSGIIKLLDWMVKGK